MRRLLLSFVALAVMAGASPVAEASFPGANGRIVYAAAGTDVEQGDSESTYESLQTIDSDSKRDRFVQGCQRVDGEPTAGNCDISYRSPVWSPDGRRLAFDAGASLALIAPSGAGLQMLPAVSGDDGQPAFSPSGAQLAFTAKSGSRTDISVIGTDGTGPRRIARNGSSPDWSKRGLIAFARRGVLYSVKPGGKRLRKLTRGRDPSWSPSGRQIAFARRGGIYVARADGKRARRVVRCSGCGTPAFSPDGKQLVYDGGGLRVVNVSDGKRLSTLVEDARGAFEGSDPAWQPR
jgi:Tol biopolymer transport system component